MSEPFKTRNLCRLMEWMCLACQVLGALFVTTLPWTLRLYLGYKYALTDQAHYFPMLALLCVSGACAFVILHHGRHILHSINRCDPFTADTVRRIRAIAFWCVPIAAVYLLGIFFIPSAFVLLVGIAFLFLAVLIWIVAEVFHQAVRYKQENDLTI